MSKPREPIVERAFEPDEVACVRALALLLKTPVDGGDGPATSRPEDATKGSNGGRARNPQYT